MDQIIASIWSIYSTDQSASAVMMTLYMILEQAMAWEVTSSTLLFFAASVISSIRYRRWLQGWYNILFPNNWHALILNHVGVVCQCFYRKDHSCKLAYPVRFRKSSCGKLFTDTSELWTSFDGRIHTLDICRKYRFSFTSSNAKNAVDNDHGG